MAGGEDDLSLVANLTSVQRRALHAIDVTTRTGLAEPVTPLPDRLDGAGREALARIQAQAEIHDGHSSKSPEEAAAIAQAVRQLLAQTATWTDARGTSRLLTQDDILIITPYNAQAAALTEVLPGFRIGTVDKFQGQEAPISIYSMATSLSCRRTTRDGVPIQSQPPERRNEPSPMRSCCRREPAHSACALPDAPADAARERARSARGDRLDVTLSHASSGDSRWGRLSTARHQPHAAVVRISGAWTATTTAGPANGKVDCRRPPGGRAAVTRSLVLPGRSGRDRDRLLTQGHQGRGGIGWLSPAE